ncbi:hypothetical protein VAWG004_08470 [Aeromonas veronii]|uniref:hypothetical protein n=1 Tax=Aeromonas veronii TaxID=654 RepID=UPI002B2EA6AC|nr:hypothetical protein VAWG004_08470 [Aeromonas veronii]
MTDQAIKKEGNWLAAFLALVGAFILSLILYFVFSGVYGSFNPLSWAKRDVAYFLLIALAFIYPTAINYVATQKNIDLEAIIDSIFDFHEFKSKKYLDALLTHYGNVATTGLFLTAILYFLQNFSESVVTPFVLAIFTVIIFFVYSLYVVRLGLGMNKYSNFIYFPTMAFVVFFDMQLIEMFIKNAPKI